MEPWNVYVLESQPVMYAGLERILKEDRRFVPVGCTSDVDTAIEYVFRNCPDLLVLSQEEVNRSVLICLQRIHSCGTKCSSVLWLNSFQKAQGIRAIQAGARGVLLKSLPVADFLESLYTVATGGIWIENALLPSLVTQHVSKGDRARISARERQVIQLICRDLRNKEIALEMGIAESTVKIHLLHIYEKTGVTGRVDLALEGPRILAELDARSGA